MKKADNCGCPTPGRGTRPYHYYTWQAAAQPEPEAMGRAMSWALHHYGHIGMSHIMANWLILLARGMPDEHRDALSNTPNLSRCWDHLRSARGHLRAVQRVTKEVRKDVPHLSEDQAFKTAEKTYQELMEALEYWEPVFQGAAYAIEMEGKETRARDKAFARIAARREVLRPVTRKGVLGAHLLHAAARPILAIVREEGLLPPENMQPFKVPWREEKHIAGASHSHEEYFQLMQTVKENHDGPPGH